MPPPPTTIKPPDPNKWILNLPPGAHCTVGMSKNMKVTADGEVLKGGRPDEDRFFTCSSHENQVQVYLVLDGHDGDKACEFVQKQLPSVFLRCDIRDEMSVLTALERSFKLTERAFFIQIDPQVSRIVALQDEINQKARNSAEAYRLYPSQVDEIGRLSDQIRGGTTAVMAVVFNNRLYVANCGDSRAVLCSEDRSGRMVVRQLSIDHNTQNEGEIQRLAGCGLDPDLLRKNKRLGEHQNSRSIGDYSIKGGYKDVVEIAHANQEPGTADPYLAPPTDLSYFRGFLLLMTDGLYEAYEAWTHRPELVNEDIAHLVAKEIRESTEFHLVAQNVVEKVKDFFRKSCKQENHVGRLDDITLVIRNFGYPPPLSHSQSVSYSTGVPHPIPPTIPSSAPVPTDGSQSTSLFFPPGVPPQPTIMEQVPPYQEFGNIPTGTSGSNVGRLNSTQPHIRTNAPSNEAVSLGGGAFIPEPMSNQDFRSVQVGPQTNNTGIHQASGYGVTNNQPGFSLGPQVNRHSTLTSTTSDSYLQHHPSVVGPRQTSVPVIATHEEEVPGNYTSEAWTSPQAPLTKTEFRRGQGYENLDLKQSDRSSSRSSLYENVTLRTEKSPASEQQRYSDSMLDDRLRDLDLQEYAVKESPAVMSSKLAFSPAPKRQSPAPADDVTTPLVDQPVKLVPQDTDAEDRENMLLYGWTGKEDTLSDEPRTLTEEEKPDFETLKESDLVSTPTVEPSPAQNDSEKIELQEDEEMVEVEVDTDIGESDPEEDVDAPIRSYVKFSQSFPDIGWDDIQLQ